MAQRRYLFFWRLVNKKIHTSQDNKSCPMFFSKKTKLLPLVIKFYNCESYIQILEVTRYSHLMWRLTYPRKGEDDYCWLKASRCLANFL